ncbi:MAG: M20/M25/M40 family metallo-hydrolase [Euryarchaeota archaeon]|nr:M20/M25/M40 family metallo-hydrolase [Euryarchaeota archaeon]
MNKELKSTMYIGIVLFLSLSVCSTTASALQVDQSNIENITEQLTQYKRLVGLEDGKAAIYIKEKMEECGLDAHFEEFSFKSGRVKPRNLTTRNVIGIKEGASNQIIIIGAHYDAKCHDCPGADDNAGGVAVMLEIARALQNESFNRTIYFIAFSAEEFGLVGSKNWLDNHEDKDNIVVMVNLDCVAYGDKLFMTYSPQCSWLEDVFISKGNVYKREGRELGSDEWRFLEESIPSVRLCDCGSHIFWDTPNDTIDILNFSLAKDCAEFVAAGVYTLASTHDLIPPKVSAEVKNGTVYYEVSDERMIQVFVDGMNFGYIESGKISLPVGEHHIKIVAIDAMGNRISDELIVDVNQTYYTVPSFKGESAVTIPWKRPKDEKPNYGALFYNTLGYEIENATGNVTVTGFLDGIKIEDWSPHEVVLTPGKHTFKVAAFNESGIVGFDEDTFLNNITFPKPRYYPSREEESNFVMPLTIAVVLVIAIISFLSVKKIKTRRK